MLEKVKISLKDHQNLLKGLTRLNRTEILEAKILYQTFYEDGTENSRKQYLRHLEELVKGK